MNARKKTIIIVFLTLVVVGGLGVVGLWWLLRTPAGLQRSTAFVLGDRVPAEAVALVPEILGFNRPRTILFLFLNNTELRPGGGFIGSYGLATVDKGQVASFITNGTENLDNAAPTTFLVEPPAPIQKYLTQKFWYFRDANWSPDFALSAQRVLRFYSAEQGVDADKISTVVGLTPDVVEVLLKYTGPLTVEGTTYSTESITDLLEYNVEIAYLQKQIPFSERKAVIRALGAELIKKVVALPPTKWGKLVNDVFVLLDSGQIMLYDVNPAVETVLEKEGWAGRLLPGVPDKIMVVDANLASLKTDRVVTRSVVYEIYQNGDGAWEGMITLRYKNNGNFDWRTTRYRTYTRLFLPADTQFLGGVGAMEKERSRAAGTWDVTTEEGATVVGAFWSIEPGEERTLQVRIGLAPAVIAAIQSGKYGLLAQKQLGLSEFQLTLHHNFGKTVKRATPPEASNKFGDQFFDWSGDVTRNLTFYVES